MTLPCVALQFTAVCLEDVMWSGDASPNARQSAICLSKSHEAKDAYFGSTLYRFISSTNSWYHL